MRSFLPRARPRCRPSATAEQAPTARREQATDTRGEQATGTRPSRTRRTGHLAGLLAGGLALFALAATPAGEVVPDVGEVVPEAVSGAIAGIVATALTGEAGADDGPHSTGAGHDRPVRTVVAGPPELAEQVSFRFSATSPAATGEADADEQAEEQAEEPEADATADEQASEQADEQASDSEGSRDTVWDALADCESGDWDADGNPIPGTARWDYGLEFAHEGFEQFQGGLNFHPGTWDAFRDPGMPGHAGHASRAQEIVVGERVLDAQGWQAWPVCSEMIGLR